jgi:hypothetical protein
MHIDDLMAMIDADVGVPLRRDHVEWESSRTQALHQKYRKILYYEKVELDRMKAAIDPLRKLKRDYYSGKSEKPSPLKPDTKLKITTEETTASKRVIKDELSFWVDCDPDVIAARDLVSQQAEKVELIKDTLDDIRKRSFSLSTILNSQRFKHGLENLGQVIDMSDPDYER